MADRHVGVLVVGAGPAAEACADRLREEGYEAPVLVCGREADAPYERPACSKGYLRGEIGRDALALRTEDWWEDRGIELKTRTSVMKLDPGGRVARLSSREEVSFDHVLLATGANVRRLTVDGAQLDGLHYLRTPANADAIRSGTEDAERIVLVGGSYLACEVAASLTTAGHRCTMVMMEAAPLSAQFGPAAGRYFGGLLAEHGVEWIGGEAVEGFLGEGDRIRGVRTASGRTVAADSVVLGTGAVPDVMIARSAGLDIGPTGGVACDARLSAGVPGVWAAGDVCEYDSVLHRERLRVEHWEVARAQGAHVALAISGGTDPYGVVPYFWSDMADWATLESVGPVGPSGSWDAVDVDGDIDSGRFCIRYRRGDRLTGALAVGGMSDQLAAAAAELVPSS